jgi:hypothetical protein
MKRATDFRVGQRVQFTKLAIRERIPTTYRGVMALTGTVRRPDRRNAFVIWVQRDGHKGTDSYHVDFWEPVRPLSEQDRKE